METLNFRGDVTIEQLLRHIVNLGGSQANENPHMIIPRSTLEEASAFTKNTISHGLSKGLIREVPYARTASEYHITMKGFAFLRSPGNNSSG